MTTIQVTKTSPGRANRVETYTVESVAPDGVSIRVERRPDFSPCYPAGEVTAATETSRAVVSFADLRDAAGQGGELGGIYRALAADALPLAERERDAAYSRYCGQSVTTRDTTPGSPHLAGYGSWVSGPDGKAQSAWYLWAAAVRELKTATA